MSFFRFFLENWIETPRTGSNDFGLHTCQVNNSRRFGDKHPSVEYQIDPVCKRRDDFVRVVYNLSFGQRYTRAENRMSQSFYKGLCNRARRYPDAYRLSLREQKFWQLFHSLGWQDKGVGAGNQSLHDLKGAVAEMRIVADVGQIRADKTEWFIRALPLYEVNFFDCILVLNAASHAVHGISGVNNNPAVLQYFDRFCDHSWLRINKVYFQDHASLIDMKAMLFSIRGL